MKLLDCTLRDGGYYTNWNFDSDMVRELITAIDMSGVSVMELGYKSPIKGGPYRKCNDNFIIKFDKPLTFDKTHNLTSITLQLNKILEEMIIANPEQWIWTHNRWK